MRPAAPASEKECASVRKPYTHMAHKNSRHIPEGRRFPPDQNSLPSIQAVLALAEVASRTVGVAARPSVFYGEQFAGDSAHYLRLSAPVCKRVGRPVASDLSQCAGGEHLCPK